MNPVHSDPPGERYGLFLPPESSGCTKSGGTVCLLLWALCCILYAYKSAIRAGTAEIMEEIMEQQIVGIVMPAYNAEGFIGEAIRSVLEQDYPHWLLFVCDDGSRDGTKQIVEGFARQDPRIRWIESAEGNTGVCGARRRGIRAAQTPWVAFLDSDDRWLPDKLSSQLAAVTEAGCGFSFTASGFLDEHGAVKAHVMRVPERLDYHALLKQNVISCSSVLIRRELLEGSFTEEDAKVCEDFAVWIRILRDREPYALGIDRPLLQYRLLSGSLSSNKIKNACKVFLTYRACGVPLMASVAAWIQYVLRSVLKYGQIDG